MLAGDDGLLNPMEGRADGLMRYASVDFPLPFGPVTATNLSSIVTSISFKISVSLLSSFESYRRKSGRVDAVSHWPVCFDGLVQLRDGNSSVEAFAVDAAKAVRGLL